MSGDTSWIYNVEELLVGHFVMGGCHAEVTATPEDILRVDDAPTNAFGGQTYELPNRRFVVEPDSFFERPDRTEPDDMGFALPIGYQGQDGLILVNDDNTLTDLLMTTGGRPGQEIRYKLLTPVENTIFGTKCTFTFEGTADTFLVEPPAAGPTTFQQLSFPLAKWRAAPSIGQISQTRDSYLPHGEVRSEAEARSAGSDGSGRPFWDSGVAGYRFSVFYHPYACDFLGRLRRNSDPADLLARAVQLQQKTDWGGGDYFEVNYQPVPGIVAQPYPIIDVDFRFGGAYSEYNWELFLHAPLLIASRLSANQRFEDAQRWFHYIFDPTDTSDDATPQRYWRTAPFYRTTSDDYRKERIEALIEAVPGPGKASGADPEEAEKLREQIALWEAFPFDPHVIARLRTTAYQKSVVMKYLDNLIAWGDQLFRQDTMESVNQAALFYILAAEILGPKPEVVPSRACIPVETYGDLEPKLDEFSNALVGVEEIVPSSMLKAPYSSALAGQSPPLPASSRRWWPEAQPAPPAAKRATVPLPKAPPSAPRPRPRPEPVQPYPPISLLQLTAPYFCVPKNDKLLSYWDAVASRLYKIRHCQNFEGVFRRLALFAPEIDPGALVRAVAGGLDISSAVDAAQPAPLPPYRFNTIVLKALQLCGEVRALGAAMLSALEKGDAEQLAALRSSNEVSLLKLVRVAKGLQKDEAQNSYDAATSAIENAKARQQYYSSRQPRNEDESNQSDRLDHAGTFHDVAHGAEALAAILHLIPSLKVGAPTTLGTEFGGHHLGYATAAGGRAMGILGDRQLALATNAQVMGAYARRQDDWDLQADLASKDVDHLTKLQKAAETHIKLAQQELDNHDAQQTQAEQVDDFLKSKYTNADLYGWMAGQLSAIYFQSYQLAFDMARSAEQAYRHELGISDPDYTPFISYGYWEDLHSGLLAGERLALDLQRLESSYLNLNRRECEITKHVSLLQLDPAALMRLLATGRCQFDLQEWLFDLDYNGHVLRRIRSVNVTIPCVTGPYTGVNCTLRLLGSSIRPPPPGNSTKLIPVAAGTGEFIVTSSGQNDGGLFEATGQDRRLPFEGAGAISTWELELDPELNGFDTTTVSDVILNLRYTAREGGSTKAEPPTALRVTSLLSARHEFPNEWYAFTSAATPSNGQPGGAVADAVMQCPIGPDRFLYRYRKRITEAKYCKLFLEAKGDPVGGDPLPDLSGVTLTVTSPGSASSAPVSKTYSQPTAPGGSKSPLFEMSEPNGGDFGSFQTGTWIIKLEPPDTAGVIEDLIIMFANTKDGSGDQGDSGGV